MTLRVLVLGGTAEAKWLASALAERPGFVVVSSLAGRTRDPRLPAGDTRTGGFGGARGLSVWLREHDVDVVVDATHPFADGITASAVSAAEATGTRLLVLRRPGWQQRCGDRWHRVDSLGAAADALPGLGTRVFLTTGRQEVSVFAGLTEHWFLLRCVEPPDPPVPPRLEVVRDKGPYTVAGELELLRRHRIEVLVTKDSGGSATVAKLHACRELGVPVVLVRRPPEPDVPTVHTVATAMDWLQRV